MGFLGVIGQDAGPKYKMYFEVTYIAYTNLRIPSYIPTSLVTSYLDFDHMMP